MTQLTYKEWRATVSVQISDEVLSELQLHHGVDGLLEVEHALQKEYATYRDQYNDATDENL